MRVDGSAPAAEAPWAGIAESVVQLPVVRTRYGEAASPCTSCPTSPCCTYLPLHTFQVTTLSQLDHAAYLLNFDRIELGLSPTGEWSVAYRAPCRHLDRRDYSCGVHETERQPRVCATYNPYSCWYQRTLTATETGEHLRLDRRRFDTVAATLAFDGNGDLVDAPTWDELLSRVAAVPPEPARTLVAVHDDTRRAPDATDGLAERTRLPLAYDQVRDPCDGCPAWCCTALVFPYPTPVVRSNLDFVRFVLGFPDVEVAITDAEWSVVVRTSCRHLDNGRCTIFGQPHRPWLCTYYDQWQWPHRPWLCTYYDQWQCMYRVHFGEARPPGYIRVAYEDWDTLVDCFRFDDQGSIVEALTADGIRDRLEARARG